MAGGFDGQDMLARAAPSQPTPDPSSSSPPMQSQQGLLSGINGNMLLAIGAGLASGSDWGEGIGNAGKLALKVRGQDQKYGNQLAAAQALAARGVPPDVARIAASNPALLSSIMQKQLGLGGSSSDIREYEYAKRQGFKGGLADWIANKRAGAGEYGLQAIPMVDAEGNPAVGQLGKSGTGTVSQFPEGYRISKKPIEIDAGTETILLDPITRQRIGSIPKDIAGKKEQEEVGKGVGEAKASLESIKSKMPGLENVVRKLDALSDKATYTLGGQALDFSQRQLGMEPREAAVARAEYVSTVNNQILPLLRDTFGAQFTEREGATLRATLGDPNVAPKEKQAVLKAFIEQKRRDVEALEMRTGQRPTAPAQAAPRAAPNVDDLVKKYGG
jgi:hypothetical protein